MTFFSRLFGTRPAAAQTIAPATVEVPRIDRALFIEESEPRLTPKATEPKREKTILEALLKRDYALLGEQDGYKMHDLDRMDLELEKIAADYRQAYDMALQDIEGEIGALGKFLGERMEKEAPELYEQMHSRQDQLVRQKRDLILQKDLAMTGEGYIERAFKYYRSGFRKGFELYACEKVIFGHIKTL